MTDWLARLAVAGTTILLTYKWQQNRIASSAGQSYFTVGELGQPMSWLNGAEARKRAEFNLGIAVELVDDLSDVATAAVVLWN